MNSVQTLFFGIREYLSPVLKNSKFKETGCITPEEFVAAGDFLVYKCPTWKWESGEVSKRRDYLPAEKQFLITRNVPCFRRVKQMEYTEEDSETQIETENGEEAWVATHSGRGEDEEIIKRNSIELEPENDKEEVDIPNIEDIPDIEDVEDGLVEEDDPATLATTSNVVVSSHDDGPSDKILQVRTYDVFITYDKYYQTPRMWLYGYDEHRRPLTTVQIFEDISQDYAKKTVTIETHPHLNMSLASIHPCRHAQVMKKIIEKMNEEALKKFELLQQQYGNSPNAPQAEQAQVRVDQYLIIFLKFMSSVVPTIDYDHTISA
ncbi:19312_t:CDS:2 [Funneliformis geosporum]|uniref:Autophagy-related protein 3 n=1 Tax=Funneliformis geosporum TaxID=1117311 RepID=A0A9W4SMM6_9GLOM|nr:13733_t:CDS:2 [Funneliformis geosporum]CAI2190231.1 19312_t:CDS:2 [Funneliformis geosporum]